MLTPKASWQRLAVPHMVSALLTKFYRLAPHKPPTGAAVLSKLSDQAKKRMDSKDVVMPPALLDHILEGFRREQDMVNYLEWMHAGLKKTDYLKEADKVTRSFFTTIRQAVHNLSSVGAVCNANVISFRRQEILNALGALISEEAKQSLRDAPFTNRDLIADDLFNKFFKEIRESRHDDVLLNPIHQQHCYHRSMSGHQGYSSYRAGSRSHSTGRGHLGHARDDYRVGSSGQKGKYFLGSIAGKEGGSLSYHPGRGKSGFTHHQKPSSNKGGSSCKH